MIEPARKLEYTFAEYVQLEETSRNRHEYLNGKIFAMTGGSVEHSLLASNMIHELRKALGKRSCLVFGADLRIRIKETGLATYPDASVVCGPLARDPENEHTVTNPLVIVEVLSPSTASYDRLQKFGHYRRIPALRDYLRISQDEMHVEHCIRNDDGTWTVRDVLAGEDITLASLGVKLSINEIYRNVLELKASRPVAKAKPKSKRRRS